MRPNADILALALLALPQLMDEFLSWDYRLIWLALAWCVTLRSQQSRILPSTYDVGVSLLQMIELSLVHHPIEPPDGSGVEIPDQLPNKTHHRQWRWRLSQVHNTTIRPCKLQQLHTIDPIEFKHHSYESVQRNQQSKNLQWTMWHYPRLWQYWQSLAMSDKVMSQHSYDYISSNWPKYTYLSVHVHLHL